MSLSDIVALVAILAQTAGIFYWGGSTHQMLRDHERRLSRLELEKGR